MAADVLKVIDDMTKGFVEKYGPVHKQETTQLEKNLTWVVSRYAEDLGIKCSDDSDGNEPYFGQKYNNLTFKIGYRIGLKERENEYQRGYDDAMADIRNKLSMEG